jgi:hypothetical protein
VNSAPHLRAKPRNRTTRTSELVISDELRLQLDVRPRVFVVQAGELPPGEDALASDEDVVHPEMKGPEAAVILSTTGRKPGSLQAA